ncbi:pilus assembly protein TadG-related protein [Kribbella sp. NPDC055110]
MTRTERGSATLHTLFAAVLLLTAFTAAILWSAISTARHKLAAAADLTALSAAQSLSTAQFGSAAQPLGSNGQLGDSERPAGDAALAAPCAEAARTAVLNKVELTACVVASDAVTVEVSLQLDLRLTRPTLTAAARAGPL